MEEIIMPNREYRAAEGISRSELFKIKKSPLHFKYALEHPSEPTAALTFGQAAHKYILEPYTFLDGFAVLPDLDRRTMAGKEAYSDFVMANAGKTIIAKDDMKTIYDMKAMVDQNETARRLLQGKPERTFFWTDEPTGERCKCRPDCLTEYDGKKYIVDYKTTDSCEDGHFERSCRKYGYQFQAGMYTEGVFNNTLEEWGFAFVAQEKAPPYAVRVYFCSSDFVAEGIDQFRELIGIYHDCKVTGNWYGYEGPMDMPSELVGEDEA